VTYKQAPEESVKRSESFPGNIIAFVVTCSWSKKRVSCASFEFAISCAKEDFTENEQEAGRWVKIEAVDMKQAELTSMEEFEGY